MSQQQFELDNVGAGPETLSLDGVARDSDFLLFQRDYHCTNCRKQIKTVANSSGAFEGRTTEVSAIVPEPVDRVRE